MDDTQTSEWIEHDGKEMPVDGDVIVDVQWGDGEVFEDTPASTWNWCIDNDPNSPEFGSGAGIITHYRVVKP